MVIICPSFFFTLWYWSNLIFTLHSVGEGGGKKERDIYILMGSVMPQLSCSIRVLASKRKNMYVRIASLFKDKANVSLFLPPSSSLPHSHSTGLLSILNTFLSLSLSLPHSHCWLLNNKPEHFLYTVYR